MNPIQRRSFLKKSVAISSFTVLPSYLVTGKPDEKGKLPPSKRVNLGVIGCGGRANGVVPGVCAGGAEVTAWCDVDFKRGGIEKNLERFPDAKQFQDFRVMLEKMGKDVDAVTVCTPDHTHFPAAMLAMSMGKHVYVEKPLTHSYWEADLLMKAEKKFGVVTQMGNQGHTSAGSEQFKSLVKNGIVKDITKIEAWKTPGLFFMNKNARFSTYPAPEEKPASLDWDLWCGPAQMKPFSSKYHPFSWRGFYLYGNGMLGDWGAHIIDFAHDFLKLGQPHKITPLLMDDHNDVIFPLSSHMKMEFASNCERKAVELIWRDGEDCHPAIADKFMDKEDDGKLTTPKLGGAGTILYPEGADYAITRGSHSSTSNIINTEKRTELREHLRAENPKNNHQSAFTAACMGETKTQSNFQVAGDLTKTLMLGVICQTLNETLEFDTKKERFRGSNQAKANALLEGPPPRKGWEQFYKMV
jgi:hypothetical protein